MSILAGVRHRVANWTDRVNFQPGCADVACADDAGFAQAAAAASSALATIVVLGLQVASRSLRPLAATHCLRPSTCHLTH